MASHRYYLGFKGKFILHYLTRIYQLFILSNDNLESLSSCNNVIINFFVMPSFCQIHDKTTFLVVTFT